MKRESKVACLLGSLNRGGTETLMLDTLKHAREANLEMICIYRKDGSYTEEFKKTGTPLFRIAPRFRGDLGYLFKLRRKLIQENVTVVHAQQAIDALYALLACGGTRIKVALTFHGYNFRYGRLRNLITHLVINRTALNIFVSKAQKENYLKRYNIRKTNDQKVVYNGISFEKLKKFEYRSIRSEFNIPENSMLLGSVGNFVRVRDQLTICRFLNLLNENGFDFHFIFAGGKSRFEPEKFDQCLNYCHQHNLGKRVFFPGSRNDIPNFLSQLDAFVYSSHFDTFGIAVIEALYMGIPVLYNDWEVFMEITEGGKHGIHYSSGDENDLFKQFIWFANNKDKVRKQALQDTDWVEKKYSIHAYLSSLKEAYSTIHAAKGS